ncbi:hypothetical protein HYW53_01915 [Candidatus Giovannonibacteria bacterium]|nr:hypothetical protein [Candidatus Giovannonibacteria bacterium]
MSSQSFFLKPSFQRDVFRIVIGIFIVSLILLGLSYLPFRSSITSAEPIFGTITFLDEYQKFIKIQADGNPPKTWDVMIRGVKINKDTGGNVEEGAMGDFLIGAKIKITAKPDSADPENHVITPDLITIIR